MNETTEALPLASKPDAGASVASFPNPLELWGGIECTVNRVGERYQDQLACNGHRERERLSDLDRFKELGIKKLRYPVLWETTAPEGVASADWRFADERLAKLKELAIDPIVGLVHHGSGPKHTSLVDPAFAEGLAEFARAVAARYPWVMHYTPVNEPLTTARFSGLYGHWYPHGKDEHTFTRALLTQCRATVLAMQALRQVNPEAKLVQTEDMGKTWSTPRLQYQADFENERRWASFDLLCGRVDRHHRLWRHFIQRCGISEEELLWFVEHPCPPDVLGINHYLTSERFLDERLERYPPHTQGGNGRDSYADVEAVRVVKEGLAGPQALLLEAWERYHLPIAVTEAHLGCTREEQMRWLVEVWQGARALQEAGVDIRAVTAWSLLGAHDWNSLLTCWGGCYEPGVFDLRGPQVRATALAALAKELAAGKKQPAHPALLGPGWWRRDERLEYPPVAVHAQGTGTAVSLPDKKEEPDPQQARPILIFGDAGALGDAFARFCHVRGLAHRLLSRVNVDVADSASVQAVLEETRPWAVVTAREYGAVDDAEKDPYACLRENVKGPATLAAACARDGIQLLIFSSDLVFDGKKGAPYVESDPVSPQGVYGRSKAEAEVQVRRILPSALIVRTGALFGPWDQENFVTRSLQALAAGRTVFAPDDLTVSPTYVPDMAHACLDLLIDGESGLWHLTHAGQVTWAELARRAATRAGIDPRGVRACSSEAMGCLAPRPPFSALGTERGVLLPSLEEGLTHYLDDTRARWLTVGCAEKEVKVAAKRARKTARPRDDKQLLQSRDG